MKPRQLCICQAEDRLIFINDCALRQPEISAVGISAESNAAWSNGRKRFCSVNDRYVLLGLVFENAQLSRAIFGDGAITIQMVGSKVEPEAYRRAKGPNGFQLERAHFNRQHVKRLFFPRDL